MSDDSTATGAPQVHTQAATFSWTSAVHALLFFALFAMAAFGPTPFVWPSIITYGAIVLIVSALRRTLPELAVGDIGMAPVACTVALAVITTCVLLGFHAIVGPDVRELAGRLPLDVIPNLVVA